jgi:LysR family transcriptional regulator, cyn operon transcriptional activator
MELRHLRYFLAVAETLHFRRAAEMIPVSQPSLSQQIKQLEEEIGTRLLDRAGRTVRLTRAGAVFRKHARQAIREMEEAQIEIDELEGLQRGALAVGVVQTVNAYLIPDMVARFSEAHPNISLKVEELSGPEIEAGVVSGGLDVGIGFIPPLTDKVDQEPLFEEDLVLIASTRHRLSARARLSIRELDGEPLVLLGDNYCTRRVIAECFRTAGVRPHVAIEMNSIEGILATIRHTNIATILPRLSLGAARDAHVKAVALRNPTPRRSVGLLWRKGSYRNAAARALAAEAMRVTRQYRPANTASHRSAADRRPPTAVRTPI